MKKINEKQKLILAILIPIGLFLIFYPIADKFDGVIGRFGPKPFNFTRTWYIWLIYVSIIGIIEFKLFENKENSN